MTELQYADGFKGKVIRDAIHGDIFVKEKYLKIIDTPEFQRLRRIKQLSIADAVFPSAGHTRFSHSIGTFYVMGLIIDHFEKILAAINVVISQFDKDIVLLAALLHDVGHGPFSHAFEQIHPVKNKNISHEEWTMRIITDPTSHLNATIISTFGEGVPEKTADIIRKQKEAKKSVYTPELSNVDLFSILSSLISSQLDADRMDYLLRDSIGVGVKLGTIDIQRIISSLQVTVYDNRYYVCVPEKYLPDIETYLLARYQMQSVVYYHDFKVQMEQIIKQIFRRAFSLNEDDKLESCPRLIRALFEEKNFCVSDYTQLDDSTFIFAFQEWCASKDEILSILCQSLLYRNKSQKMDILGNEALTIQKFKIELQELLNEFNYDIENFEKEYFWIEKEKLFNAYKPLKENIWVQRKNGVVEDISLLSKIIHSDNLETAVWQNEQRVVFINYDILKSIKMNNVDQMLQKLGNLTRKYNCRNVIEIERKYFLDSESVFGKVQNFIEKYKSYKFCIGQEKEQIDVYYDTIDRKLEKLNITLRIRTKGSRHEVTIKIPINENTSESGQSERFEYQKQINNLSIGENLKFIEEHIPCVSAKDSFIPTLTIANRRMPIMLQNNTVKFEMVFDRVTYISMSEEECSDLQIEIELKSDYSHRASLKMLTDDMESTISGLIPSKTSKYLRGMELLVNRDSITNY